MAPAMTAEWTHDLDAPISRYYVRGPITAARVSGDEIVLNIGLVALHMSEEQSFLVQRAITNARVGDVS